MVAAALRSTPLTTMGQIIQLARQQDLNEALNYATLVCILLSSRHLGSDWATLVAGLPPIWMIILSHYLLRKLPRNCALLIMLTADVPF